MIKLLIFILIAYGATNIMVYGSIFEKFRAFMGVGREKPGFFGKLFGCFMCLSFWWGVILSYMLYSPTMSVGLTHDMNLFGLGIPKESMSLFFDACLASAGVWLLHTVQERIEV